MLDANNVKLSRGQGKSLVSGALSLAAQSLEKHGSIPTDCVIAPGALNADGYKRVRNGNFLIMLHRLVWESVNGETPIGHEIHHTCSNRACYNLAHLELIERSYHKTLTNKARAGTGYFKAQRKRNNKGQFNAN